MDRLKIETYIKGYEAAAPGRTLSVFSADEQYELAKLALSALSQEAVRDEALEEAAKLCDELAAKHKKMGEKAAIKSGYSAATTNGHINAGCGALQCADLIRALKREPNAAAELSPESELGQNFLNALADETVEPAPAAPDVSSMVRHLKEASHLVAGLGLPAISGTCDDAAALLAKLGQVPVRKDLRNTTIDKELDHGIDD